ncbi:MAG: DUF5662 family protein [Ruminococcus sp.]
MHPWLHFKTITKHKLMVMHYCFRIGLYKQGLLHDLSKYTPSEFLVGCKYYQENRSPNNAEREDTGVSTAWLHHKGRNKHHYEHWVDYSINDPEHVDHGSENASQICGRDGDGQDQCLQDLPWGRIRQS